MYAVETCTYHSAGSDVFIIDKDAARENFTRNGTDDGRGHTHRFANAGAEVGARR